jgi:predicted site-specific integrase-resolvase
MEISSQQRQEIYNLIRSDSDIGLLYADLNSMFTTYSEKDYSKRSLKLTKTTSLHHSKKA